MAAFGRPTAPLLDKMTIKVPTMGDSITEVSIEKRGSPKGFWMAGVAPRTVDCSFDCRRDREREDPFAKHHTTDTFIVWIHTLCTQGTIVEWTVSVGEAVQADDVIALVETDKVTVDIKAEADGVIVEQFGAM